ANAEIATEMYISINTIKSYIRSAYRKMNVTSRSQAVIWAIDHGVVSARATREQHRQT
ncbi:MAG: regulatory protein LuxR, partial [Nocardioidaceae bacterium]|nr:regulatory protein LuxR [Nocardioidaceae bacterium]